MSVRIESALPQDTPAILRLHLGVLEEGRWFIRTPAEYDHDPFTLLEHIKEVLRADNAHWWVARRGPELVGFATAIASPYTRLRHVARFEVMVHHSARGAGVGRALTEHAITWARANPHVHKLSLAVFDDNDRAITLYRRLGFAEEGRRPGEYLEPDGTLRGDVLMAMDVARVG